MLSPKKVKFRKRQRGHFRGEATACNTVAFGDFALAALETMWITNRQIEAARIAMTRHIKRGGKVWIRIFPAKPYTHKPPETRMGSGKGNVEYYVAVVKPGRIMFEVGGLDEATAVQALKNAQYKFSIKTKVVARHEAGEQA